MLTLEQEVARAKANGDVELKSIPGGMRSVEIQTLEKGDIITFGNEYKPYEQTINSNGRSNKAYYVFATCQHTDASGKNVGDASVMKFYTGTFTKSRRVVNKDTKEPTGVTAFTKGSAAEAFRANATIDDAMKSMMGKKIKVTDLETVNCLSFDRTQVVQTSIPTLEFA